MVSFPSHIPGVGGLGFLHTSPVHVERFEALLDAMAPQLRLAHVVDESLLNDAVAHGIDMKLESRVRDAVLELVQTPVSVVVCTCSTLGAVAERVATVALPGRSFRVLRVDRPMIERAVAIGGRIGVVASLESALPHARALFEEVAAASSRSLALREFVCEGAWSHFEAGDLDAYAETVAAALPEFAGEVDVLVLAQASLEDALERLPAALPVPVFSSPRSAAEAALGIHRELSESARG